MTIFFSNEYYYEDELIAPTLNLSKQDSVSSGADVTIDEDMEDATEESETKTTPLSKKLYKKGPRRAGAR